jgi:hypothetical protein
VKSLSLLSALLLGATALTFAGATGAAAKVGVTSAVDGDPLGKPPTEAERVLRVGIDVQANEIITTKADDRAHLMFLDGTSLTVGPDANLVIDKFVYDPNTKTGDLAITASKGVFRLVGGKISKTSPITITTPSSTIGIRGGIGAFSVTAKETISFFIFGISMTINASGQIETITRAGSWATTLFGGKPGTATLYTKANLEGVLKNFDGKDKGGNKSDADSKGGGFSKGNSGKGADGGGKGGSYNHFGSGPGPNNQNPNNTISNVLSQVNQVQQDKSAKPPSAPQDTTNTTNTANQMASTITYKGTMAGFGLNNGRFGNVNGTYQMDWRVGSQNGITGAQVNGVNYGGGSTPNTNLVGNGPLFATAPLASQSGPATTLTMGGAFTGAGPNSPGAGGQVGAFAITGNRTAIGGVFAGTKQ